MARADLLVNLVKSGASGDRAQFKKTVESLIAEERAKKHTLLADRLSAQLEAGQATNGNGAHSSPNPTNGNSPNSLVTEISPNRGLNDLILPTGVEAAVRELVEEQHRADLLRSHNLEPRHRVLLAGPPGNGKTSLAEAIAYELMVPLLIVRYESVVGSFLGETAARIARVFEYARSRHCVLFFDEFDAVGKERGDVHETGEIKRVVSSLLMQFDGLPSYVVAVTASNHPELLDRAVWRRFQLRLNLPNPRHGQIKEWFSRFEDRTGHTLGVTPHSLATSLKGLCFAEVEEFGTDVLRRIALAESGSDMEKVTRSRLKQWKERFSIVDS